MTKSRLPFGIAAERLNALEVAYIFVRDQSQIKKRAAARFLLQKENPSGGGRCVARKRGDERAAFCLALSIFCPILCKKAVEVPMHL
jgi:hypothetical protein